MPQASETRPGLRHDSLDPAQISTTPDTQGSSSRPKAPDSSDSTEALAPGERRAPGASSTPAAPTTEKPRGPAKRPQPKHRWVDQDYYHDNPWFDQEHQRPIFSLGAPLPRTARWARKKKQQNNHPSEAKRSKEELAELGEVTPEQSPSPSPSPEADAPRKAKRRTSGGVTHGHKYNDAGQPVFEYIPEKSETQDTRDRRRTKAPRKEENQPHFGIDSEPIGRRENEEADKEGDDHNKYRNWWARVRAKHPEPLAEFLAVR
jgi:hypothetical protein